MNEFGLPSLNFGGSSSAKGPDYDAGSLEEAAHKLGVVPPTKLLLKEGMGLVMKKPAAAKVKTQKSQQSKKKKTIANVNYQYHDSES